MMKSGFALIAAAACWESTSAIPAVGFDLPRELVMDVNKAPYPVVNIIADQPSTNFRAQSSMQLSAMQMQTSYKEQANVELQKQQQQLKRLSKLRQKSQMRSPETLPVVNVRLSAPKHPLPEVAAEIALLENSREQTETALMGKLQEAFESALANAKNRINKMVIASMKFASGSQAAFLQARETDFAIKVSTVAVPVPDPSIKGVMDKIEGKRNDAEQKLLSQAAGEMEALTDIVLNELGAQLQSHTIALGKGAASFLALRSLPAQANVRVEAGTAFPTIASMVQAMEARRDGAESQEASKVLELELKLLQEENDMIKTAVNAAIANMA